MSDVPPSAEESRGTDPLHLLVQGCDVRRQYCNELESLAVGSTFDVAKLKDLVTWVWGFARQQSQFNVHVLFPRLQARLAPEDDLRSVIARLSIGHEEALLTIIVTTLTALEGTAEIPRITPRLCQALRRLAAQERRQVAFLSKVILPIARVRLTSEDAEALEIIHAALSIQPIPPIDRPDSDWRASKD